MMLLEKVAGPLVPSRVKIFTQIFEKMPRLATTEGDGVDFSRKTMFYGHLLPALRFYMPEDLVQTYESLLIAENLSIEGVSLDKNELLKLLNSTAFGQIERDEYDQELEEALSDCQFNPFLPSDFASEPLELIKKVCQRDGNTRRMKNILLSMALGIPSENFPHANFSAPKVFICERNDRTIAPKEIVANLISSGQKNFSRKTATEDFCKLALEESVEFDEAKGTILALREENVNHPEFNRWLTSEKALMKKNENPKGKITPEFRLSGHRKWTLGRILTSLPRSIEAKVAISLAEKARNSDSRELYEKIVNVLTEQASKITLNAEIENEKKILETFLQFAQQKLKVGFSC